MIQGYISQEKGEKSLLLYEGDSKGSVNSFVKIGLEGFKLEIGEFEVDVSGLQPEASLTPYQRYFSRIGKKPEELVGAAKRIYQELRKNDGKYKEFDKDDMGEHLVESGGFAVIGLLSSLAMMCGNSAFYKWFYDMLNKTLNITVPPSFWYILKFYGISTVMIGLPIFAFSFGAFYTQSYTKQRRNLKLCEKILHEEGIKGKPESYEEGTLTVNLFKT
jgi:hypothetical protein